MGSSSASSIAGAALNESCILEEDSFDSDDSVSKLPVSFSCPSPIASVMASAPLPFPVPLRPSPTSHTPPPLQLPHLHWPCAADDPDGSFPVPLDSLIDGSHLVLIRPNVADRLGLRRHLLHKPLGILLAMEVDGSGGTCDLTLKEWVKLKVNDHNSLWVSRTVRTVVAPGLCANVVLGLPWLSHNCIVVDHEARTAIDKTTGFDLLHPKAPPPPPPAKTKLLDQIKQTKVHCKSLVTELKTVLADRKLAVDASLKPVQPIDVIAAIRERVETLAAADQLKLLGEDLKTQYEDVFRPVPHTNHLGHQEKHRGSECSQSQVLEVKCSQSILEHLRVIQYNVILCYITLC
jgi:hypothetical protein